MKIGSGQQAVGDREKLKLVSYVICALLFAPCSVLWAQQPKRIYRIGYLSQRSGNEPRDEAFRRGLHEIGYTEGRNVTVEWRFAKGSADRLSEAAAELVRLKVNVIFAVGGTQAILAAKNATTTIPIIFAGSTDAVALGLVADYARPGGNITGYTLGGPELYGKRLELIKETLPKISRAGLIWNPSNQSQHLALRETQAAARTLGLQIQSFEARSPDDIDGIFEAAFRDRIGALSVGQVTPMTTNRNRIVELAAKRRLPAIYGDREWPESGGLISYGPNITELHRRAATYIDKILKGANPAELPVEQPTKFELLINLKAAKEIAVTIPPNVLARADKVIR
jgi:ABC-type uncharacterized transport system substrate-binding protein